VIALSFVLLQALLLAILSGAESDHPATLGIFMDFESTPSAAAIQAMQKELKALLAPANILPAWRPLRRSHGNERFDRVVIVRFKGSCRTTPRPDTSPADLFAGEIVLANTKVKDGRVLPFAEVECDNVKKGIGKAPLRDRSVLFGNLLGRVVAHELYHLLLETVDHQRSGIAKAVANWHELLATHANFALGVLHTSKR
jgi:hypothetical protein